MSDPNRRAAERRRTWAGGVARSPSEMDQISTNFWLSMSPEERIGCVFDLWDEQTRLQDPEHEPSARLQRAVGGVRGFAPPMARPPGESATERERGKKG